jgi:hypothetical protein
MVIVSLLFNLNISDKIAPFVEFETVPSYHFCIEIWMLYSRLLQKFLPKSNSVSGILYHSFFSS